MAEPTKDSKPPRRGRWLRWTIGIVAGLFLLLVVAYFVVTSGAFFKGFILPRVSAAAGADVTVADASISPFSQVVLRGLKVQPKGAEPLLTAAEVRARYRLMAILRGNINVDEVAVVDPVIQVVMNADGTSNLDAFTKRKTEPAAAAPAATKPGPPPQIDIRKVTISKATVHFSQAQKDGTKTSVEVAGLDFSAENLKNSQRAKLTLGANLKLAQGAATNLTELAASLKSSFDIDLGADLLPTQIQGDTDLGVTSATGAFADASGLNAKLNADLSLTEIKQIALNFTKGGAALGKVTVSGPLDILKQEGKLTASVTGIGNQVLSLVGGRFGIYFGSTQLAAKYEVELKNQARYVNTTGTITADNFSLTRSNLTTPVIDFQLGYNATVDLPRTNATLREFTFNATQAGRPLLKAGLTKAMVLDWGKGSEAVADSAFELNVPELNLAEWKPFLGEFVNAGVVNGKLVVTVQKGGQMILFDLGSKLTGLAGQFGSNRLDKADLALNLRGQMAMFDKIELSKLTLDASRLGQAVTSVKASGTYSAVRGDADFQTEVSAALPRVAELLSRPDLSLTDGTLSFNGHVTQQNLTPGQTNNPSFDQRVTGKLQVADLTGHFAANRFDRFTLTADLDAGAKNNLAEIHQCTGSLRQAGQPGGGFEVAGSYQMKNQVGDFTFKLTDLNQHVIRSFAAAALAPRTLDSISINADATAHYDAKGDSGAKGSVQVVNVLLSDPAGQLPKVPMTADVKLDAMLSAKGLAAIKQLDGRILQGAQPAGDFQMTASYDLTNQTAQATLKLSDLNQNALQPFLAGALGNKTLAAVSINASLNAGYDPKGASDVKGELQVTNLVVKDPTGEIPATPLEAKLKLDAGLRQQVADIRQFALTLTPTDRARNEVQLKGQVDYTRTNAITGNLKLAADSIDVTRYYDLFVGQAKPAAPTQAAATPAPASDKEPPAVKLPVKNFTAEASVGRFYLREVAISNFLASVKLDGGTILVKPFQLSLNGAPINSTIDLDLGVPGYKYNVDFTANSIPLAPLVNSFQPERKGQVGGSATATAQVKGAGVTGASLQKNLAAQFDFAATNLNLSIGNVHSPIMKSLVNLVVGIPDLIKSPGAALGNLLGRLTGRSSSGGGFADELMQSPIDQIVARGRAGNGVVELQQALVQSPAFAAEANGTVTLAPVLTNSAIQIPIMISLRRSLAEKVGLVPAGTPTNAAYAKLPDFVKMKGTVGEPKPDINYLVLASVVAKSGEGIIGNAGAAATGQAAGILGAVGSLLGAKPAAGTNPPPATNAPPTFNPFDLFKRR